MTTTVNPVALNLRAIWGRAYVRIVGANREPSWIFFDGILPLLGIAAYVFIYEGFFSAVPTAETRAAVNALVGFVVLGGVMIAFWMNVLWSMASQLYWEKEMGNLQLYMLAPMSRMALLGGRAIGGVFMTSVRALVTLVAGIYVFGVHFQLANPLLLVGVFFVTLVALYGMGMLFASLYLVWGREAYHMSSLLEEPIFLVSGFYFPIGAFGSPNFAPWGRALLVGGSIIPATLGLDALRQLLFPASPQNFVFLEVQTELLILVGLAILFFFLARYSLRYMELLARRDGRLTTRHQ